MANDNPMKEWEEKVRKPSLLERPETKREFKTPSGYTVNSLYTPTDLKSLDYWRDVGFPGQFPFTRGRMPNGYRSFEWPHDFYAGYGSSESANKRYLDLIAHGATVISVALDLPTQIGLDSDHPLASGEVGQVGLALASLGDAERAFKGIDLEKVGVGFGVANSIGAYALSIILALAEKRGMEPTNARRFRIQNDPIREYTGRGTYIFPVPIAVELATDVIEYVCRNLHDKWYWQWVPQYVNTSHLRCGGVNAGQEIGLGLAHCFTYIESALKRGLSLEEFVPKMDLHMSVDSDLFEEVAKFRAARRLWARLVKHRYKCEDPRVLGLRLSLAGGIHRMTAQQPFNNLIRITTQVLAGMLGGVETMYVPAYDEALALPTFESTKLSYLAKFILHYECGLQNTVDPLGGSYYVENLTSQIEEEARYWLQKIEEMGGVAAAIKEGLYFKLMEEGVYRYQKEVESGERVVIGVNKYCLDEETPIDIFQVDPKDEQKQIKRLKEIRRERNNTVVKQRLERLFEAATQKTNNEKINIVPNVLEAVRSYATIGEIYGVLREVFGEYKP